ncbi:MULTISPECIES: response regulator transcription factor [Kribbella]|uniref:LuxR family two component transcriptional regulator n=1 Tax=Kribbella pratensis TaxID=2512112 RepID=A0ABY2FQA7_9ACTN|nr:MULTISPECIES: response regulator transcription factor [Kribbella]TDW95112.1 LuxR family two component transcriptional regulator [Kribbella pratensis]TDX03724.1 LuxR family two component transcriptional regulator [Kribbella sp. VKM Ac-2566]
MSVRVVVADDQTVVRDGLVTLLKLLPGIDVIAAASDGLEAVRLVGEHDPDVLLVDLRMPTMDGVEATRRVRADHPRTEVVVLTTYSDDDSVLSALRAGALGFLTKDADAESIGRALQAAAGGQSIVDADVQRRLVEGTTKRTEATVSGLTPREVEVLRLIADGLSNTEIARHLVVSEATVKTHINHLFAKANLRDRAQAVAYAYRLGLA